MTLDLRLAAPAVVAWIAVGVLIGHPELLIVSAVALWLAAVVGVTMAVALGARSRSITVGIALACAAAALLVSVAAVRQPQRQPEFLADAAQSGRFVTATVETSQATGSPGEPFTATLRSLNVGERRFSANVPVLVFVDDPLGSVGIGSTLKLRGTVSMTDPADSAALLFFTDRGPTVVEEPPWVLDWANELRATFRGSAAALPGSGGDLLPGLAIGDTSAVSPRLDTAMKATSLSHLTAVSGANCAVLIAIVMLAGAALGIPRGCRVAASVVILLGFVVLVTPEPSVLRAAAMATLVLGALLAGRPLRGVPTLALACLVILAVDPWLSRSYGFILSVLATGGLLVLAGPLTRVLRRWLPLWLAAVIAIPLSAQLACQPVLILLSPSIPTYGVLANLLAEPAAPIATVLGLLACALLPLLPGPGLAAAHLAWVPSAWIAAVAEFLAGLPGASIPWAQGAIGVAAAVLVVVLLLGAIPFRAGGRERRWRRASRIGLGLVVAGYLGIAGGDAARQQLSRPGDWQIAMCDIGQGDAVLVRSGGRVALIDAGPDVTLLKHCLDTLGIGRLDLLVLTHYDIDHVGGAAAVLGRVDSVLVGPPDGSPASELAEGFAKNGAIVSEVSQGVSGLLGDLRWDVLWPRSPLRGVLPGNDASVTLRFAGAGGCTSGCLSSIFLGDLGREPQALLMAANRLGRADVVKVAHHGSSDQNPRLYAVLAAKIGLIGVGADNGYGHPTDSLLRVLAEQGTLAVRSDIQGMALLSPRPDGTVSVWTEHPATR